MAKKHFLNLDHKDLSNPGSRRYGWNTRPGRCKQIELSLRRGADQPPVIHWNIASQSEDELFLKEPVVQRVGTNDEETKVYYDIKLPNVAGVEYTVKCRFGDEVREHEVAHFQTWRRITLNVECPNEECLRVYNTAFSRLQTALRPAFIEVVQGSVKVDGEYRRERIGGQSGCEIEVIFDLPDWDKYGQKFELRVTLEGVTGSRYWSKQGDLLVFDLSEIDKLRPQVPRQTSNVRYIEAIEVTCEGTPLLSMPAQSGYFPEHETQAYLQLCKICKDGEIVEDEDDVHAATEMFLDLDSEPLRPILNELADGKTVEISVTLGLEQWGRSAGGAAQNAQAFHLTYYPDMTARKLVGTLAHELAHTMYLVKEFETSNTGVAFRNLMYHGNDYGGNGPHCRNNAKEVETGGTTSGYTYEFDPHQGPL